MESKDFPPPRHPQAHSGGQDGSAESPTQGVPSPAPPLGQWGRVIGGWRPSWLFLQDPTVATLGNTQKGQVLNEAAFTGAHVCTYATRLPGAAPSVSEGPAK